VPSLDEVIAGELARIEEAGLRRRLRRWSGAHGPWIELDGQRLSSFSSNNYLGLAGDPRLARRAAAALEASGVGAAASRLVAGNHQEHEALEQELAAFHRAGGALLFNSGFQANTGVIPALVGRGDLVLSDQLNHASLIDGCRLSRAEVSVYPHANSGAVREILRERRGRARRALVVTDAVFSMDGDRAPLADLAEICQEHDAWLMVDEAHAVGVLGPRGEGLSAEVGIVPEVRVGTLGKAFGTFGAYAVGSAGLRELLLQRARSFIFSTALPPAVVAASRAALEIVQGPEGDARRAELAGRVEQLAAGLRRLGRLLPGAGASPIVPLLLGPEQAALDASRHLLDRGIHAQPIRPPTVPPGTSRLRFALSASHSPQQVEHLLAAIAQLRPPTTSG